MRVLLSKHLFLTVGCLALLLTLSFVMPRSYAASKGIKCNTAYGEKTISIKDDFISFNQKIGNTRDISSSNGLKGQRTVRGINQTIYMNGNKHLIHIENINRFDSENDYLAITSPKGHKMTYPLDCQIN